MASTRYTAQVEAKGKFVGNESTTVRSKAIAQAEALRKDTGNAARVITAAGTVVFEIKAKRQQAPTIPFTRVDERLEAKLPKGYVVAYFRPRKHAALLRNEDLNAETRYLVLNVDTGETTPVETTRDGGQLMKAGV